MQENLGHNQSEENENNNITPGQEPVSNNDQEEVAGSEQVEETVTSQVEDSSDSSAEVNEENQDQNVPEIAVSAVEEHHELHPVEVEVHEEEEHAVADLSTFTFVQLVERFESLALHEKLSEVRAEINQLKATITQKIEEDKLVQKQAFLDENEADIPFSFVPNALQNRFLEAQNNLIYRDSKEKEEKDKEYLQNLKVKEELLTELRQIVSAEESQNSFQKLRDLQAKWKETGNVPAGSAKDINQSYKALVDKFYDQVKIHKELMEMDFKRNLEFKTGLCEKAEELLLEESVRKAIDLLNHIHDQWKSTGPVSREHRVAVWERFKAASDKIYDKRRSHFNQLSEVKKQNYALKQELVEKVKAIDFSQAKSHNDWGKLSEAVLSVQAEWKKIGFAPKPLNEEVWAAFKGACDDFFNAKNNFYKQIRQDQNHNLNVKNDLCVQAEALMHSEDWKKTTDALIQLQKAWKESGAVPKKHSDKLWNRFRAACDAFFNRKNEFFSGKDQNQSENLAKKVELISEIEAFVITEDPKADIERLKDFQRQWLEIGFIPIKEKEAIYKRYKEAIDARFDSLKLNASEKTKLNYQSKIHNIRQSKDGANALKKEQGSLMNRINGLKNDILLWQNNMEFLSASKNADILKKEIEKKIALAQEELKMLNEKMKLLRSN